MTHESHDGSDEHGAPYGDSEPESWLTPQRKKILIIGGVVVLLLFMLECLGGGGSAPTKKDPAAGPKLSNMGFDDAKGMTDGRKGRTADKVAAISANSAIGSKIAKPTPTPGGGPVVDFNSVEAKVIGEGETTDGQVQPDQTLPADDELVDEGPSVDELAKLKEEKRLKLEQRLLDKIRLKEGLELSHEELVERLIRGGLGSNDITRVMESGILLREITIPSDSRILTDALRQFVLHEAGREFVIEMLGSFADRRAFLALEEEFENGKDVHALPVIDALGYLGDERAIPLLVNVAKNDDFQYDLKMQQHAITSLARIGGQNADYALSSELTKNYALLQTTKWALAHMNKQIKLRAVSKIMPPGRKKLVLRYKGTQYLLYHPVLRRQNQYRPRLLVCVHDNDFNADIIFELCKKVAKDQRVGVLAPLFDPMLYPYYESMNIRNKDRRADKRLMELMDTVAKYAKIDTREIFMFGQGDGGSFVMNFALSYPDRVSRVVIAHPREVVLPDDDLLFPKGLMRNPLVPDIEPSLRKFLKTDVTFIVGPTKKKEKGIKAFDKYQLRATEMGITSRHFLSKGTLSYRHIDSAGARLKSHLFPQRSREAKRGAGGRID